MRIMLVLSMALLLVATSAQADTTKFELMGSFGWSFSDGVSFTGRDVDLPDGTTQYFNNLDLSDGMYYGAGIGYFMNRNLQIGFLWDYQQSELVAQGSTDMKIADMGMDNFHGVFIYNFGGPLDRMRPILFGGLGATSYRGFDYTNASGQTVSTSGETQFSTTWGAGAKITLSSRFAIQLDMKWTPTYIKSDPNGYWCDPYYGCYTASDAQYANQFKLGGTLVARF